MACAVPSSELINSIVRKHDMWCTLTLSEFQSGDLPTVMTDASCISECDAASDISDDPSTYSDSDLVGASPEEPCSEVSDVMRDTIFIRAIAVAQLAEAAMLACMQLPSEQAELLGVPASPVTSSVISELQKTMATAQTVEQGPSRSDCHRIIQLLNSMKLAYDEEKAESDILAAIAVLQSRFASSCPRYEIEEKPEHTSQQIALRDAAEHACSQLAKLTGLLLPKILYQFARMSSSVEFSMGKVLVAKAVSCARLAEATFSAAATLSKAQLGGSQVISNHEVFLVSQELRKLAAGMLRELGIGSAPKDPASVTHDDVLNTAAAIVDGMDFYEEDKDGLRTFGMSSSASAALDHIVSLAALVVRQSSGCSMVIGPDFE